MHSACNINVKLNHKIPIVFHNLKNYDSNLIMQELGKFSFKINIISNRLEKYIGFRINNKVIFIDSFPSLILPSLSILLINLNSTSNVILSIINEFHCTWTSVTNQ